MPFYIRKAFNIGPIRINLSKSGLGASVGVRGARISTGPRGPEVHAGRYGLYYRERIGRRTRWGRLVLIVVGLGVLAWAVRAVGLR
jgi:hypothetical protein